MALIYIYMHTNKINNKKYIGQIKQNPERRWREGGKGYVDSPKFWNAIQKYGWDNFEHEIIEVINGTSSEAARWCGLNDKGKSIKACCIGNQKTAGTSPFTRERLSWSFVEGVMN